MATTPAAHGRPVFHLVAPNGTILDASHDCAAWESLVVTGTLRVEEGGVPLSVTVDPLVARLLEALGEVHGGRRNAIERAICALHAATFG